MGVHDVGRDSGYFLREAARSEHRSSFHPAHDVNRTDSRHFFDQMAFWIQDEDLNLKRFSIKP
jgi:hypothetical protein